MISQVKCYSANGTAVADCPKWIQKHTFLHNDCFYRSCDRSLRSLDQESPPKKKKLQPTYTSTTHLLAGKKCPSSLQTKSNDIETTIFYIPGVDVKVSISPFCTDASTRCCRALNNQQFSFSPSCTTTPRPWRRSLPMPRADPHSPALSPKSQSCMVWKIAVLPTPPLLSKARLTRSYLPRPHLFHQVLSISSFLIACPTIIHSHRD